MKLPLDITFRGLQRSEAVETAARRKAEQLERFAADIVSCRVVIEQLQARQVQGRPFGVRIELAVPGRQLVANQVQHEDVSIALRDAFDDMRRQLEDAVRQRRGEVKHHVSRGEKPG
jgi:ribosome-associated translation inhibitor RaiA